MPYLNANDSSAKITSFLKASRQRVTKDEIIASAETSKASYDLESPSDGWLFWECEEGDSIQFGGVIARVFDSEEELPSAIDSGTGKSVKISKKAQALIDKYGLSVNDLPGKEILLEKDVLDLIKDRHLSDNESPIEDLDPALLKLEEDLTRLLAYKRQMMRSKFNRHVPSGTLLNDRWSLARDLGFGESSSVYDESLVLGNVRIGHDCWIGPYTILDGSGGSLDIGNWSSIGSGVHVYSHHTIAKTLTGGKAKTYHSSTIIGNNCFIAPNSIIAPGTRIGDSCFVAAFSYVEGIFEDFSYISGNPARIVGRVVIQDDRARLELFPSS